MDKLRIPAEWSPQERLILAWPHLREEWGQNFDEARRELRAFVSCCAEAFSQKDSLILLCHSSDKEECSALFLANSVIKVEVEDFWDIWVRDTAPVFANSKAAVAFSFNGWGGKYDNFADAALAEKLADLFGASLLKVALHCEGGALEHDGEGHFVTTRQCLLNSNRNPGSDEESIQRELSRCFSIESLKWINSGLLNDHTDGHVDTLFRFGPNKRIVIMRAESQEDPNAQALEDISRFATQNFPDFSLVELPSPGCVRGLDGAVLPASYLNFLFLNGKILVPLYGVSSDSEVLEILTRSFPGWEIKGLMARAILSGGGAFHCISQQVPKEVGV